MTQWYLQTIFNKVEAVWHSKDKQSDCLIKEALYWNNNDSCCLEAKWRPLYCFKTFYYFRNPEFQYKTNTCLLMRAIFRAEFLAPFSSCSRSLALKSSTFESENIIIWVKTLPYFTQMMIFHPIPFLWQIESKITRARWKRNHKFRALLLGAE